MATCCMWPHAHAARSCHQRRRPVECDTASEARFRPTARHSWEPGSRKRGTVERSTPPRRFAAHADDESPTRSVMLTATPGDEPGRPLADGGSAVDHDRLALLLILAFALSLRLFHLPAPFTGWHALRQLDT